MGAARKPLGMAPAADEAAERRRKLAEYDEASALLAERLGPSAQRFTLAELLRSAFAEVDSQRAMNVADDEYGHEMRLTACEADIARALGLDPADTSRSWEDYIGCVASLALANVEQANATAIDSDTPEGVLALLDAATLSLLHSHGEGLALEVEAARDSTAAAFDLPLRNPARFAALQAGQAARGTRLPESKVDLMAHDLASRLGSGRLLAQVIAGAERLPSYLADDAETALALRGICERLAAAALALGIVLGRSDSTGGAW